MWYVFTFGFAIKRTVLPPCRRGNVANVEKKNQTVYYFETKFLFRDQCVKTKLCFDLASMTRNGLLRTFMNLLV